jgi:hypothetical protein
MSVYVGIDVHRKRSQAAVIGTSGEVLAPPGRPAHWLAASRPGRLSLAIDPGGVVRGWPE